MRFCKVCGAPVKPTPSEQRRRYATARRRYCSRYCSVNDRVETNAKLKKMEVEIRKLYFEIPNLTLAEIAKKFNLTASAVCYVVNK